MALGNLAMDAPGRKGMLEVFTVLEDLTQLLAADDIQCRRSTCLTLGNLLIEEEARDNLLSIPMSVRALSDQLKSRDLFLVRYIPRPCVHVCMCACVHVCMCACACVRVHGHVVVFALRSASRAYYVLYGCRPSRLAARGLSAVAPCSAPLLNFERVPAHINAKRKRTLLAVCQYGASRLCEN